MNAMGVWPPMVELMASAGAVERHGHKVEPIFLFEQLAGEVGSRAGRGMRETVFAGIGLDQLDQVIEVLCRNRRMAGNHVGRGCNQRDGREILDRVIGQLGIHAGIDDEAGAYHEDRVAVGCRLRDHANSRVAAGAGNGSEVAALSCGGIVH